MPIEVFADIWCPFAHVGLRTLFARRHERGRDDLPVLVRAWPLELVNGKPADARSTAEHVAELRADVAPHLFEGFDPDRFPTTSLPALALAAAAYRHGQAAGEAVSLALRDALFEQGRRIDDPDVLAGVAAAAGIETATEDDAAAVRRDWEEGQARGVKGSPHLFCAGRDAFCPSLDISRADDGELVVHRDTAALDAFLDACF